MKEPIETPWGFELAGNKAMVQGGGEIYPMTLSNRIGVLDIYGGGIGASAAI